MTKNVVTIKSSKKNRDLKKLFKKNWNSKFKKLLNVKGAILFRGFKIENINEFNSIVKSVHKKILNYEEASTPRSKVKGKVYTSTEISPKVEIPIHNEMSYASKFPNNLWFYSSVVAKKGGQTTIANSKKIYDQIDTKIKREFEKKKIMYVRKYGYGLDLSIERTFNTKNKKKISNYCKKNKIKFKWESANKLITWKINNFSYYNKDIKSKIWFNQAHLFHNSNYDKKTRFLFNKIYGKGNFPRDTKFGNGKEIPILYLKKIRKVLEKNSINVNWKPSDILVLNNLMISHGRRRYAGNRKVFVLMTNDK
tara:strand:+ start:7163 stop:8089 length:927 start_codon:yes stop_codon:yes gene_type:complete